MIGWYTSKSNGYSHGYAAAPKPVERYQYEFKEAGGSLLRVDKDTGKSCYVKMGKDVTEYEFLAGGGYCAQ